MFVSNPATIAGNSSLPTSSSILKDKKQFCATGNYSVQLLWFKIKLMTVVNCQQWDPFCKGAHNYYGKCTALDEAMGLWALHFKDHEKVVIKTECNDSTLTSTTNNTSMTNNDNSVKKRKNMEAKDSLLVLADANSQ